MNSDLKQFADQRRASAGGDVIGGDKITMHVSERQTQIEGWLEKLADEMRDDPRVRTFVDNLQYYFQPYPYDDVIGLEAKLDFSNRSTQKKSALRKKEAFAKLLDEWQAYPSAQEIIAYFLSQIDSAFETEVQPMLSSLPADQIDSLIKSKLVDPVLKEMGCGPFMLNYNNVSGMVYWLAEQCYIRWHT